MADENTAVNDLIQNVLASKTRLEPDPGDDLFLQKPEVNLRKTTVAPPPVPRRPSATPALPITRSEPAHPDELAQTVRGQRPLTAHAFSGTTTLGPRAATEQPRMPTAQQPTIGRAASQDFSRTTLGQRPPTEQSQTLGPRAATELPTAPQPTIGRAPSQDFSRTTLGPRASTEQPAIARVPTAQQPTIGRSPSQDFSRTTLGQRPPTEQSQTLGPRAATEQPAIARVPTAPQPTIARAPSQDFSRTTLGPRPPTEQSQTLGPRAATEQPAIARVPTAPQPTIARAPSQDFSRTTLGPRAATEHPAVARVPTAQQPTIGRSPSQDFSRTTLGPRPPTEQSQTLGHRAPTEQPAIARVPTAQPPTVARVPTGQPLPSVLRVPEQPAIGRTPTAQPVPQDLSRTMLGQRAPTAQPTLGPYSTVAQEPPVVGRAPTAQPAVGRTPSQQLARSTTLGPYSTVAPATHTSTPPVPAPVASPSASSVGQPLITWTPPDAQPAVAPLVSPLAQTALAQPATDVARARTTAQTALAQTALAQPVLPQTAHVSYAQPAIPTAHAQPSIPHAYIQPASALAYSSTMLAQPAQPEMPLPPYTPAPNLGDPGEHDETVPAEKFDFTELVDRYDPIVRDSGGRIELPAPRDSILEMMPPRFDFRALAKQSVRYLPLFGAVALLLVFVGGYLAFDDSGSRKASEPARTHVTAPKPEARVEAPANVVPAVKTDADAKPETKDDAKVDTDAKSESKDAKVDTDAKSESKDTKTDEPSVKLQSEPTAVVAPKPVRGKLYIAGDASVQIYLNGRSVNRTAPAQLTLPPGNHKVTLWNQKTGKTTSQFVTIVAGETAAIR